MKQYDLVLYNDKVYQICNTLTNGKIIIVSEGDDNSIVVNINEVIPLTREESIRFFKNKSTICR